VASRWTVGAGLGAFGVEALLCAAAWGAGILATAGAVTLIGAHGELPLLGRRVELLLPLAVALFGVLPSFFVYRARAVIVAALVGAAAGAGGHFLFDAWHAPFFPERPVQTIAFGVVGFLLALLLLGMRGGTRRQREGDVTPSEASTPSAPAPPPPGRARS
jgi:hypothetical protein